MLCIKNGRIHDAVHREPYTADILIENGKLLQIGTDLHAEQTIDAAGLEIYPGFVEVRLVTDDDGGDLARGADEGAAVSAEKRGRRGRCVPAARIRYEA